MGGRTLAGTQPSFHKRKLDGWTGLHPHAALPGGPLESLKTTFVSPFLSLSPTQLFSFFNSMTDLTMLHAPSTLYLPETNEAGFRFTFNRRSYPVRSLQQR